MINAGRVASLEKGKMATVTLLGNANQKSKCFKGAGSQTYVYGCRGMIWGWKYKLGNHQHVYAM